MPRSCAVFKAISYELLVLFLFKVKIMQISFGGEGMEKLGTFVGTVILVITKCIDHSRKILMHVVLMSKLFLYILYFSSHLIQLALILHGSSKKFFQCSVAPSFTFICIFRCIFTSQLSFPLLPLV